MIPAAVILHEHDWPGGDARIYRVLLPNGTATHMIVSDAEFLAEPGPVGTVIPRILARKLEELGAWPPLDLNRLGMHRCATVIP